MLRGLGLVIVVTAAALGACAEFRAGEGDGAGAVAEGNDAAKPLDGTTGDATPDAPSPPPPPPPSAADCVVPATATLLDVDEPSAAEERWQRPPGQRLAVYFEGGDLPMSYAAAAQVGAAYWSESPCIDARFVARCPAGERCVTMRVLSRASNDPDEDGDTVGKGSPRESATLTLYTDVIESGTDRYRLATVVHEMGHALGLRHRRTTTDVMNEDHSSVEPKPDATDFHNLKVLYGTP